MSKELADIVIMTGSPGSEGAFAYLAENVDWSDKIGFMIYQGDDTLVNRLKTEKIEAKRLYNGVIFDKGSLYVCDDAVLTEYQSSQIHRTKVLKWHIDNLKIDINEQVYSDIHNVPFFNVADNLMIKMTEKYGARTTGVLLSNSHDDGIMGAKAIKDNGGIVLINSEKHVPDKEVPDYAKNFNPRIANLALKYVDQDCIAKLPAIKVLLDDAALLR